MLTKDQVTDIIVKTLFPEDYNLEGFNPYDLDATFHDFMSYADFCQELYAQFRQCEATEAPSVLMSVDMLAYNANRTYGNDAIDHAFLKKILKALGYTTQFDTNGTELRVMIALKERD